MFFQRLILAALLFTACAGFHSVAFAQSDTPKVEVGVHFTSLRLSEFEKNDPGVGARVTFNLNKNIALEGEFNFLPREQTNISGDRKQGLFGVKAGWRNDRFGVFGKARPGFIHFSRTALPVACVATDPPPLSCTVGGTTPFAFDLGGVLEFYPSQHTVVRFDAGDTMIRYERLRFTGREHFVSHNPQFSIGVGYRF
ncbi:MAG: porin family protein [Acidobacteria bacterium]|nr:porin family protein [Acidobacteriota bacterium]